MDRLNASSAQLRGLRSNMVVSCPAIVTWAGHMCEIAAFDSNSERQECAMQTAGATATVASTMQKASGAMAAMGAAADPHVMQQNMAAFSRENQRMDMASGLTYSLTSLASLSQQMRCANQCPYRSIITSAWCCCTDMMGDAIDGAFEDDEDESDAIMSQVRCGLLDTYGIRHSKYRGC